MSATEFSKAIFLDRDGTINYDAGYTHDISEFRFIEGAIPAMKRMVDSGFHLFVVTNQAGVARGYYSLESVDRLHRWISEQINAYGISVTEFLVCPHHPDITGPCDCRKPGNYLLEYAISKYELDRKQSWMIGDRSSDVIAGQRSNLNVIGIDGEYNDFDQSVARAKNLSDAWRIVEQFMNRQGET